MQKLKVNEYAKAIQCDVSTVYRWIKTGKIETETIDGVLRVLVDEEELQKHAQANIETDIMVQLQHQIEMQQRELERKNNQMEKLQTELFEERQRHDTIVQQLQQDLSAAQQRSDTIILQFTRQFEQQNKLLEDMRQQEEKRNGGFLKKWFKRN